MTLKPEDIEDLAARRRPLLIVLKLLDAIMAVSSIVLLILIAFMLLDPGSAFMPVRPIVAVILVFACLGVLLHGLNRALTIRSLRQHYQLAKLEASELSAALAAAEARGMAQPRRP